MQQLGHTRSSCQRDHLVLTPDTFVRAALPGMRDAVAIVHANAAVGAKFTQYTVEYEPDGSMGPVEAQRFLYVLEGSIAVTVDGVDHLLTSGGYAYIPVAINSYSTAINGPARAAVIEKPYVALQSVVPPAFLFNDENSVPPKALGGDPWLEVRSLLPDDVAFDFAVNTMTYQPGATLPMVEVHVMEHGLLMLEGGGIYRLGDCWYPCTKGDFIYMAPYCPQWFGALGKTPAKYLIYKDWNRV